MKTNPELSQTLDLVDKNIKTVVIFYIVEKSEKRLNMLGRNMEHIFKNQNSKDENTLDGINEKLDIAEEKNSKLEDIAIELSEMKQREKNTVIKRNMCRNSEL